MKTSYKPSDLVHVGTVKDGAVISFNNSPYMYMKVCGANGIGGVVRLAGGKYIPTSQLTNWCLNEYCYIEADDLDAYYFQDEGDDF